VRGITRLAKTGGTNMKGNFVVSHLGGSSGFAFE
jgi:hypothetical protein